MEINSCGTKYTNDDVPVELAKNAIGVQDACNLSGVVFPFARDMKILCEHPRCAGTAWKNHHPVATLCPCQIAFLVTGDTIDATTYEDASAICRQVVDGKAL